MMRLLNHLDRLGTELEHFSYEELKISEAIQLKQHYMVLQERLHQNIFGLAETDLAVEQLPKETAFESTLLKSKVSLDELQQLIAQLRESDLDPTQRMLVKRIQLVSNNIGDVLNTTKTQK
ncbi:hypothetical protein [Allomuricauda sp. SCSIO 65647]|uniref:hypothetical protein n=1 Tax=Allomuricauda sp. SCSIO 65647 TaxID=2908843 RepID=UPI001F2870B4|nr:hypothetical protein [Muricauda sp. SCSIO 65647]UJH67279.1 hypothetical protein L0P89_15175 [Muricauda sp. SCSIO 65647]